MIYIEHKGLYNTKGPVPVEEYLIPFGEARIQREGIDVTLVAVSKMVNLSINAAVVLEKEGISVEVVDPRTIVPWDRKTIADSIRKTGRLVVIDEAGPMYGFSAEIIAVACEECFDALDAPPLRICSLPVPHPFSPPLENEMIPSLDQIVTKIRELVAG